MSVLAFPVADVIARLAAKVSLAKAVGAAADLQAAIKTPPNVKVALYVLAFDRGGDIKYTGPGLSVQNVNTQLQVVVLVRHSAGERVGAGARKLADDVIAQVRGALVGWAPADAFEAISFRAGRDDNYLAGWYAGQQVFDTAFRIHNEVLP